MMDIVNFSLDITIPNIIFFFWNQFGLSNGCVKVDRQPAAHPTLFMSSEKKNAYLGAKSPYLIGESVSLGGVRGAFVLMPRVVLRAITT